MVLEQTNISEVNVIKLTDAAEKAWEGLVRNDMKTFSEGFLDSFKAQVRMFPKMMNDKIAEVIDLYKDKALAWKLSGAGGGGYLILISETKIPNTINLKIRIKESWI
jgi:galactokinase/mevalonate kinase-like predicted kinase